MEMKVCVCVCVCCSLRVFAWDCKRIKACSQPRVQTGPFLIVPSVRPIGWWGINLPLCRYMCLCQTVWARLSKNSNISFLIPSCQEPPSLPLSLPHSIHLTPAWKTSPVISSCGICCYFTDSFFDSVSRVDLHFLLKSGQRCRPRTQLPSQRPDTVNTSNKVTSKIRLYTCW